MAFSFSDLQQEVARRSILNQSGSNYTTAIQNSINLSMWRIARDAKWRTLRRETTFNTISTYAKSGTSNSTILDTNGNPLYDAFGNALYGQTINSSATLTNGSNVFTVSGATFLTDDIHVGRFIKFDGSVIYFKIATITSETSGTLDQNWDGASASFLNYSILPQEEYVLPIQIGHSAFFWHRKYGMPKVMEYVPAFDFYKAGVLDILTNIPVSYRMWGVGAAIEQLKAPSVITISSSVSNDSNISVTVFGTVAGYPDYEVITTSGTTPVNGLKVFSCVERIVKNQSTLGRITLTANSGNCTVGVLPVGSTTTGPVYTKVQVYPLPNSVFPINCFYYKLPYQLINAGDVPELGEDFSEAIILLSCAKLKAEQNMTQDSQNFMMMYKDEIASLKKTNIDKIDWKMVLKRAGQDGDYDQWTGGLRFSQIGGSGQFGGSWNP